MFSIGDKVQCIDDMVAPDKVEITKHIYVNWVKKGEEYTIREVYDNDGIVPGVLLEEVHNFPVEIPLTGKIQEPAFATWRFRKIASRKIGITETVEMEKSY